MSIEVQFDLVAQCYDKQRTRLIPCFNDFYYIAIDNLNFSTKNPNILYLGSGTGLLSHFILEKYPEANITLVDLSEKMLKIAEERFASNSNIKIIQQDFSNLNINVEFDAVVSSLAIHHLDEEDKISLYNKIYSLVNEGGLFINAEQIAGETEYFNDLYDRKWREKVESSDLAKGEIEASYERIKLDKRTAVPTQLKWLKEAGFNEVDCLYKYYDFAVIYCKK